MRSPGGEPAMVLRYVNDIWAIMKGIQMKSSARHLTFPLGADNFYTDTSSQF
jgi:hypothetical protein